MRKNWGAINKRHVPLQNDILLADNFKRIVNTNFPLANDVLKGEKDTYTVVKGGIMTTTNLPPQKPQPFPDTGGIPLRQNRGRSVALVNKSGTSVYSSNARDGESAKALVNRFDSIDPFAQYGRNGGSAKALVNRSSVFINDNDPFL